ncbi:MAG: NAD(P)-binding domain-containing protein [Sandaracinaceae bacterium]
MSAPSIGVIGGGGFGKGVARAIARGGHEVIQWSRRGAPSGERVRATDDMNEIGACALIFVAVPSMHVPSVAPDLAAHLDGRHMLVHVSRGLIGEQLQTVSRYLATHTPARRVGCLAGPLNPTILEGGQPGGAIVGSRFPEVARAVKEALSGPTLRLYESEDVVGVEVASAMVGLLAMQAGFCLERRISPSAMGVMMTRGLAEAARVGVKLGGHAETFNGLAGAGDLFAAIAGDERSEVLLGRALAQDVPIEEAGRRAGAYIEGLSIARRIAQFAVTSGVEAPICAVTADVLDGKLSVEQGLKTLMIR